MLYTDGVSNQAGCGAGIILTDPEGIESSHCFRFEFNATNNEVEYEALLVGMKVAKELSANFFFVRSDSQLVINQVSGQYQAMGENMVAYLEKVQEAMTSFKGVKMDQIPRDENRRADVLAKIVSTGGQALPKRVPFQLIPRSSIAREREVNPVDRLPYWMDPK
ncbi:hypothetical protein QYF36_021650 [Acer negundo]|nr:hypothetical protein QYF36_021650 [Acer negundo]